MRIVIAIGILLLATATLAGTNDVDSIRPVPSIPYSYQPSGSGDLTNVAIFRDQLPWGSWADDDILVANSIAFTVFGGSDIGNVDLSAFDKVIISNQQPLAFNTLIGDNAAWFEAYAEAGGVVLLGLAHYFPGDIPEGLPMPGGYMVAEMGGNDIVTLVDSEHEVFTLPNMVSEGEMQGWGWTSHGDLNTPFGSMPLVMNAEFTSGPALAELALGDGWIIATTLTYQWNGANPNFAENLVLYLPKGVVATEHMALGAVKCLFR